MADISRYHGGAMRKPKASKQLAPNASNASALASRRATETRALLDSQSSTEDDASPVRRLNLTGSGGELNEELPLPYARDQRDERERQAAQQDQDGLQINPSASRTVTYRRRFKNGGAIRGKKRG